ncbi:MAG: hypothetical protein O7F71_16015 [Gammaproteobacteria bacterium]|nr:hypothetical protein [Gammaproteobacteria bacterium]
MIRIPLILAISRAETRSTRRLARYWIFAVLSVLVSFLMYMQYTVMHGLTSRFSATIGSMGPRYLMAEIGLYMVIIFVTGLIFLAFDVRSRDIRERMVEVLDSRPVSNGEFLIGRTLGLVLMAWIPVLIFAFVAQAFGLIAMSLDLPIGEPIEPYSLANFIVYALSAFVMWCSAVVLLAVLIGNRLLVVVAALALFGLQIWGVAQLPVYLQGLLSVFPMGLASDVTPLLLTGTQILQRLAMWILAAGFLVLAVAFHPRRDDGSKARQVIFGASLVALAGVCVGFQASVAIDEVNQRSTWLLDHEARREEPRADVLAMEGSVIIQPGSRLDLDLQVRLKAPANSRLDTLLFTFNPGLKVEEVSAGGEEVRWTHTSGLLEIALETPLAANTEMLMTLVASGSPDTTFGYLDSAIDLMTGSIMDSQLLLLGIQVGVFDSRYVALMPGNRWLPHAGSDVPGSDARTHPADYFEIDLEVEVPADWLVAGPGRREALAVSGNRARFRFHPDAPLPEVGLLASRFERRAVEAAGVEFEVLLYPKHRRNLELFADAGEVIGERLEALLNDAENMGFSYPYGGFSLVESPANLRGYGGGWRMDSVQAMPGLMLLRETSFPTSRFEVEFRNPESLEDRDGGILGAKLFAIERYFENDFSGGNLFLGASRNFLRFQTSATGEGALAINFVLDELVNRLLTGKRGYFSAHEFNQQIGFLIGQTMTDIATGRTDSIVDAVIRAAVDRPSVWDRALETSLTELNPTDNPKQALNVLALKCEAIANSIFDGLGRERTAALVTEVLTRYRGGHFSAGDFEQIAIDLGADLEGLIGDWLNVAALPGFLASAVVVDRLVDDEDGIPRYQTRVHVRNDEPTPGLVRLRYATIARSDLKSANDLRWETTEPHRIGGYQSIEIGILSSAPPTELWLQPYLALNRQDVRLTLPRIDEQAKVKDEALIGARPSLWGPNTSRFQADIVIDDLDEGFSVAYDDPRADAPAGESSFFLPQLDLDQGLPEFQGFLGPPSVWSRSSDSPTSWGKYRRTVTLVKSGTGDGRAVFTADLPHPGRWQLAYHIPEATGETKLTVASGSSSQQGGVRVTVGSPIGMNLGVYNLTLLAGGETYTLEFDGSVAEPGWNDLGQFELDEGETQVVVTDKTSGTVVIADAIRWRPSLSDKQSENLISTSK